MRSRRPEGTVTPSQCSPEASAASRAPTAPSRRTSRVQQLAQSRRPVRPRQSLRQNHRVRLTSPRDPLERAPRSRALARIAHVQADPSRRRLPLGSNRPLHGVRQAPTSSFPRKLGRQPEQPCRQPQSPPGRSRIPGAARRRSNAGRTCNSLRARDGWRPEPRRQMARLGKNCSDPFKVPGGNERRSELAPNVDRLFDAIVGLRNVSEGRQGLFEPPFPAFVMPPWSRCSPDEYSEGVRPR